jgi:hypothetical protein
MAKSLQVFDSMATFGRKRAIEGARSTVIDKIINDFEVYDSLNESRSVVTRPICRVSNYVAVCHIFAQTCNKVRIKYAATVGMPQFQQENLKVRTKNLSIARRLFFSFQSYWRNGAGLLVGFGNASGAESPSAMKFLCNYIEQKASDAGLDTLDRSLGNMRSMFEAAENDVQPGSASSRRSDQLKWQTFVARLKRKINRERASIT